MQIDTHLRIHARLDKQLTAEATRRHVSKNALVTAILQRTLQEPTLAGSALSDRLTAVEQTLEALTQQQQTQGRALQDLTEQLATLQRRLDALFQLCETSLTRLETRLVRQPPRR